MNFIGRNKDLEKIANKLNEDNFNLTLVYGRRRVGKSELVKQAIKACDFKNIYYECKQVSELNNVESLAKNVSTSLNMPPLGYKDIESLLRYLFEYAKNEKLILVLDEYPYLKNAIGGIDSVLQSLIDEYREESKLSLIILGSYVDVMKSLLEHSNPLYGRVDLCINLTPMDYYESSLFYPNFSNEDKVRIYSVFGGIPYYNRLIDDRKSVKENIINLIASEDARLENEVSMYLNSEISKIINTNEVLEVLAKGYSKYKDILSQSHVSSGPTLVDVLDKLIRMEIVEKVTPINEPSNKKKTYYRVKDNLSLFYYRYIFPHSSELKIMNANAFFDKYIKKDFDEYFVPHQFEIICAQYIIRLSRNNFIYPPLEKIGKYYYDDPINHTNGEFDIVSKDENGYIFYEVKFRNKQIKDKDILEEIEQIKLTGLDCYKYVFFTKSEATDVTIKNISLIKLNDLFIA